MKKVINTLGVFLIGIHSVLAQSYETCNFYPFYATDYIVSGNFSQDNSNDKLINDVVMLRYNNVIDKFKLITLTSDSNGNRTLNENFDFFNYDLANVSGRMVKGDFDNDGHIDDFILINKTGVSSMRFDLFKSDGAAQPVFSQSSVYYLNGYDPDKITGRVVSGDFDGDGNWDDIAAFYDYGNGETRIHVWLWTGSTFSYQYSTGWWNSTGYTAGRVTDRVVSGDFDKDGKVDDIAAFYDYGGGEIRIHVWLSTGSSFWYQGSNGWYKSHPNENFIADRISKRVLSLNIDRRGENYDDIVAFYKRPINNGVTRMIVWRSDGTSFNRDSNIEHVPNSNWENGLNPDQISGKIVEYDSRNSSFTQGKPSDIIGFSNQFFPTQFHFWKSNKTISSYKIEYSTPYYCESKSTNKTDFDALDANVNIITYPNPTKGLFTVEVPNYWLNKDTVIEIRNLFGEVVFSEKIDSSIMKIDLTNKTSGIYILKISNSEQSITRKIIKE